MLLRSVPVPALPTFTRVAERPAPSWSPFPYPEYPGAQAAYIGSQPRVLQDPAQQLMKMKTSPILDESAMAVVNTPLVQMKRIVNCANARVLAKLEGGNHCFSSKARVASAIIRDAEYRGLLKKGMHVIEPVDHITVEHGVAIASVCASMGYPCVLVMPAGVSPFQQRVMQRLGAKIVETNPSDGMAGAVAKLEEMLSREKTKYFVARFFTDEASTRAHEITTATEIWEATDGKVDCLVAPVLTGATLTGIRRFFDARGRRLHTIAVEPADCAVLSAAMKGQALEPRRHGMAGMGCGHIPGLLELKLLDHVECVAEADARQMAERLGKEEGILTGLLGGAVMVATVRAAQEQRLAGSTIVCILPLGDPSLAMEEVTMPLLPPMDSPEMKMHLGNVEITMPSPIPFQTLTLEERAAAESQSSPTQQLQFDGTPGRFLDNAEMEQGTPQNLMGDLLNIDSGAASSPPMVRVEERITEEVVTVEYEPRL